MLRVLPNELVHVRQEHLFSRIAGKYSFVDMGDVGSVRAEPHPQVIGTTALLSCSAVAYLSENGVSMTHLTFNDFDFGSSIGLLSQLGEVGPVSRIEVLHGHMSYPPHREMLEEQLRFLYGPDVPFVLLDSHPIHMSQSLGYQVVRDPDGFTVIRPVYFER